MGDMTWILLGWDYAGGCASASYCHQPAARSAEAHSVAVRSLAPIVSLCVSLPPVLHYLLLLVRSEVPPVPLILPPLGQAIQATFPMDVRLWEIRFASIRLSVCSR